MTKEEKNNVTRLSAICALNVIYLQGCKKTIEDANIKALKQEYKYDTLSIPNKKVVDKKIKEAIKNLHLTIKTTAIVLDRIDKSMRNTLGDLVTDELIDKLDAVLSDLELEKLLTLRK